MIGCVRRIEIRSSSGADPCKTVRSQRFTKYPEPLKSDVFRHSQQTKRPCVGWKCLTSYYARTELLPCVQGSRFAFAESVVGFKWTASRSVQSSVRER